VRPSLENSCLILTVDVSLNKYLIKYKNAKATNPNPMIPVSASN
jgi:hypothetical protein